MKAVISLAIAVLVAGVMVGCGTSEAETLGPPAPHVPGPKLSDMTNTSKASLANPTPPGNTSKK